MTTNSFDELSMQHRRRGKAPSVRANPAEEAALSRQRSRLAVLEETELYRSLCVEADARRLAEARAPKYASGRTI